ncbi:MAG: aminoglycoside 6-adenylyltransferase [Acidimicrobiia bacterium]|nr:aminoglycoside 6-adenylyltransferase [Acidimicrobiia bacterium]
MKPETYQRFTEHVRSWAVADPDVIGLVAVGSMAERDRSPDEWSDHDFWVVAGAEAVAAIRDDPSWLPDDDRIILVYDETEHGRNVIYDDGHLIEFAVFAHEELEITRANDYRVLVDKADLETRMAAIVRASARHDVDEATIFGRFVGQMVIGLTRYGRGELLSADSMIRKWALENLLTLIGRILPPETDTRLDNLDPRRRFEAAFPVLGERLNDAATLSGAAAVMIDIAEEHLAGVPSNTEAVRATLRNLLARAARAHDPDN